MFARSRDQAYDATEDDDGSIYADGNRFFVQGRRLLGPQLINDKSCDNESFSVVGGSLCAQQMPAVFGMPNQARFSVDRSNVFLQVGSQGLVKSTESSDIDKFFNGYAIPEQAKMAMTRLSIDLN